MKKKIIGISMAVLGFGAVAALNFGIAVDRNNLSGSLLLDNVEALASETKKAVDCYKKVLLLSEEYGRVPVYICPTNHIFPLLDDCPSIKMAIVVSEEEKKETNKGKCMIDVEI